MMKSAQLAAQIDEMLKETKKGTLNWKMQIETTDDLDPSLKQTVTENGVDWLIDECFVAYECTFRQKEFCMISYEHVMTNGAQTRMTCLIFLPPLGMRFFDVASLGPYAIEADAYVSNKVHVLWETLMALYKENPSRVQLSVVDPLA